MKQKLTIRNFFKIDYIRYCILALGYTEKTLAEKCGLTLNMLKNILHNKNYQFKEKNIMKIISTLQLDLFYCVNLDYFDF